MYKSKNPYKLKVLLDTAGQERYYVFFKDGTGKIQEIEVPQEVFLEFKNFEKENKHEEYLYNRYIEHIDFTEEQLNKRALHLAKDLIDLVEIGIIREKINEAITDLPRMYKLSFILYFEYGLSFEKISKLRGCSKMAVKKSIDYVIKKIRKHIFHN